MDWRLKTEREGYSLFRPCSCLLPKPFGRWHFCEALRGSYGAIVFFSPKYHNIFPENKISHPKVLCIIYWLWIKRCWLQSQSQISKSCLSVGRYQILYLCGALCIMGTVITHKQQNYIIKSWHKFWIFKINQNIPFIILQKF